MSWTWKIPKSNLIREKTEEKTITTYIEAWTTFLDSWKNFINFLQVVKCEKYSSGVWRGREANVEMAIWGEFQRT